MIDYILFTHPLLDIRVVSVVKYRNKIMHCEAIDYLSYQNKI